MIVLAGTALALGALGMGITTGVSEREAPSAVRLLGHEVERPRTGGTATHRTGGGPRDLVATHDLRTIRARKHAADHYGILLVLLGLAATVALMMIPGRRGLRIAGIGGVVLLACGALYLRVVAPGAVGGDTSSSLLAGWNAALPTLRIWLVGAAALGVMALVFGLAIEVGPPEHSRVISELD